MVKRYRNEGNPHHSIHKYRPRSADLEMCEKQPSSLRVQRRTRNGGANARNFGDALLRSYS